MKRLLFFLMLTGFLFPAVATESSLRGMSAISSNSSCFLPDFWMEVDRINPAFAGKMDGWLGFCNSQNMSFSFQNSQTDDDESIGNGTFVWGNYIAPMVLYRFPVLVLGIQAFADISLKDEFKTSGDETEHETTVSAIPGGKVLAAFSINPQCQFGIRAEFSGMTDRFGLHGTVVPGVLFSYKSRHQFSICVPLAYSYTEDDILPHLVDISASFADDIAVTQRFSFRVPASVKLDLYATEKNCYVSVPITGGFSFSAQVNPQLKLFIGSDVCLTPGTFALEDGVLREKKELETFFQFSVKPSLAAGLEAQVHPRLLLRAGARTEFLCYSMEYYSRKYTVSFFERWNDTLKALNAVTFTTGFTVFLNTLLQLDLCADLNNMEALFTREDRGTGVKTENQRFEILLTAQLSFFLKPKAEKAQ